MKKKGMFLTSILLCISMIMTNFAGLGNGVTKAKADPNLTVMITVNNDDMGCASASTEEYGEYCGELNGTEGQTIYLCAKEYYDYSRFKEWKIIQGDGEIANPNEKNTTFTFGTENTEIQAVFEEKKSYSVSINDWIYGEGEIPPIVKDSNNNIVEAGYEYIYYYNESCEPVDMVSLIVDEETTNVPAELGVYYVKIYLYPDEEYKKEEVVLPFSIKNKKTITSQDKEMTYIPGTTFDVASLFPSLVDGDYASFSIVSGTDAGTGTGSLEGTQLTITKVGSIKVKVVTAATDTTATGSAIAVLTVAPAEFTADTTSLILEDGEYTYSGTVCSPTLTVKYGESTLTEGTDYEINTTASIMNATEIGTYTVSINGIGNFTGSASTTWKIKDSTAPVISGVEDDHVYYGPVSITVTDDNLSKVTLKKDDGEPENINVDNGKATLELSDLGVYFLSVMDGENNSTCCFAIAKQEISITGQDKSTTYDAATSYDVSLLFTVSDSTKTLLYSIIESDKAGAGKGSLSGNNLTIEKAGTITIKAAVEEGTYNTSAEDTAILTVAKAEASVDLVVNNVTYGIAINPVVDITPNTGEYSIVYTGRGNTQYTSSSNDPIEAGSYTATVTYQGNDLFNGASDSVDFVINPAVLTVTANNASKKIGTEVDPELTYTVRGFVYNEKAEDVLEGALSREAGEIAKTYNILQGTLTANKNYTISFTGATFTILPKDSFVISVEKNIEVAGSIVGAGSYEEGQTVTLTATPNSGYKFVEWQENNAKVADTNEYSFTASQNRNLIAVFVEKETPTLNIYVVQWTYGDSSEGKVTVSGNAGDGTETIIYYIDSDYTTKTNATNSGAESEGGVPKYAKTYYVEYTVGETANYKSSSAQTSFAIDKAEGIASITIQDVTYGTAINPTVDSTTNAGNCEIVYCGKGTTEYTASSVAPVEAGSYTATVTYPENDSYTSAVKSADFTINPATLTVTANDISKKVGSSDPDLTYTVDGFKYNDANKENVLTGKLSRVQGETANEYAIEQGTLTTNKNYTIAFTGATFTIKPKDVFGVTVDLSDGNAGLITGAGNYEEGSTVTLKAEAKSGYNFVEWQEDEETVSTNAEYSFLIFEDRNLKAVFAEKENLELTVSIAQWTYGDSSEGKVIISGNDGNGEEAIVYYVDSEYSSRTNITNSGSEAEGGAPKNAGTYYVKLSVAETENYKSGFFKTAFEIKKKTLSDNMLFLEKASFAYTVDTSYTPALTVKDDNTTVLIAGTDYEIVTADSVLTAETVGVYSIKVIGKGNYTGTASVTWVISKDDITAPVIDGVKNNDICVDKVTVKATDEKLMTVTLKKNDENEKNYSAENGSVSIEIKEAGTYIVKARDTAGNETVCGFKIIETPEITGNNKEITYYGEPYVVANLFTIPENAGTPSFSIVTGDDAGTGAGTISGNKLTITKAGTIKIRVITTVTDTAASGNAIALLTVDKAEGVASIEIQDVVYGSKINPIVKSNTNTGNPIITYKGRNETSYTTSTVAPTKTGNYTATVKYAESGLFKEVTESVDFDILPATLTIIADNVIKKVDAVEPKLTYTVRGLQNNDLLANVVNGELAREVGNEAGTYAINQGTIELKDKNYTLTFVPATFTISSKDIFTVSISNSIENAGVVSGDGRYEEDTTVTLIAEANSGYKFVSWEENNTIVSTENNYTFDIDSNRNFKAVFSEKMTPAIKITVASWTYGDNSDGKVTYTGNEGNGDITVIYYTDENCTIKTNKSNGAIVEGGAPRNVGTYYVKVNVTETKEYKSGSAQQSFTISPISNQIITGNDSNKPINVTGIGVDKSEVVLDVNGEVSLIATLYPQNADNKGINWTVSGDGIITLSKNTSESGSSITVKAVKPGKVTITARATGNSNIFITTSVEVKDKSYNAKVNWTVKFPSNFTKGTAAPVLKYTVTAISVYTGETKTSEEIAVTATSVNNFSAGSTDEEITFVATADLSSYFEDKEVTKPAKNVELSKTYKFKEGSDESGSGSKSGKSPSEPEEADIINLFYTDSEIVIPLPEGADPKQLSGKCTSFFKVDESGNVTVTGDRKKAATAANSLIVMPVMDGKTQIGEFSYQLPVSYVKPKLKLSKTSATIKKGSEQTVDTVVLEKKSNGLFEAIDISNQEEGTYWTAKKGSAVVALGDEAGQLFITASDATNGSIVIKQENWAEAVELKFSVKAKATDVLSASAKKLVMNTNAAEGGAEQSVTILLNNKEITEESNVTVTMPKGWESANIDVEGIEEGKLVSSEVKFSYKESAPKKGNYTFKFAAGKAKVSVKLSVSDAALADKAVSLKVKTKLDLVSGQKMVLEPIRKNIAGEISDVALDETSAALFDIEYNDEVDQIYIMAKDVTKLDTKTKYNFTVSMNVGGKACSFTLKNQKLAAKKPSVKLSKATMPKANVTAGTAVATVNVLSTSKLGGKIFTVAPLEVSFNGTQQDDGTWQISDKKGTATVSYNAEEGTITIVSGANASGKMPAIKATLKYNGGVEIKNKTISIKVK